MFPCLIKGPENNCQEQTHNEPKIENYIYIWINFANYWFAEKAFLYSKYNLLIYLPVYSIAFSLFSESIFIF